MTTTVTPGKPAVLGALSPRAVRAAITDPRLARASVQRWWLVAALGLLALMVPTLGLIMVDARELAGTNVWLKPLKFQLAQGTFLLTLWFFTRWLPDGVVGARWFAVYGAIVIFANVAEMLWLLGASSLGVASHFNYDTLFSSLFYYAMGGFALVLTTPALVFGWLFARPARTPGIEPGLRVALASGLVLAFVLTLVTAFTMASGSGHGVGLPVGADPDALVRLAFFGWLREAGDLRVPHFFATHAIHFIPALALVTRRVWLIGAGAATYGAFVITVFVQALMGQPFLAWLG